MAGAAGPEVALPPMARAQTERTALTSAQTAGRLEPAPTPNKDLFAPRGAAPSGPVLSPSMFRQAETFRGDGYTPGSAQSASQETKHMPLPGLSLKVPLN